MAQEQARSGVTEQKESLEKIRWRSDTKRIGTWCLVGSRVLPHRRGLSVGAGNMPRATHMALSAHWRTCSDA